MTRGGLVVSRSGAPTADPGSVPCLVELDDNDIGRGVFDAVARVSFGHSVSAAMVRRRCP
jgi:hypothetical protein